jgi:hypothetical protein
LDQRFSDRETLHKFFTAPSVDDFSLLQRLLAGELEKFGRPDEELAEKQRALASWMHCLSLFLCIGVPNLKAELYRETLRFLADAMKATASGTQQKIFKPERSKAGRSRHLGDKLAFKAACLIAYDELRKIGPAQRAREIVYRLAKEKCGAYGLRMTTSSLNTWKKALNKAARSERKTGKRDEFVARHRELHQFVQMARRAGTPVTPQQILDLFGDDKR